MEIITALILGLAVPMLVFALQYALSYVFSQALWALGAIFSATFVFAALIFLSIEILPGFLQFMGFSLDDGSPIITAGLGIGMILSALASIEGGIRGFDLSERTDTIK